jgi:hypothetical protein
MKQELSYKEQKKQNFGKLCSKGIMSIATETGKRVGEVDSMWKGATGLKDNSNIINKYKSGKSLPSKHEVINWLIEFGVNEGKLDRNWVNELCSCLNYSNDELIT